MLVRAGNTLTPRALARLASMLDADDLTHEIGAAWAVKEHLRHPPGQRRPRHRHHPAPRRGTGRGGCGDARAKTALLVSRSSRASPTGTPSWAAMSRRTSVMAASANRPSPLTCDSPGAQQRRPGDERSATTAGPWSG
ncbi:MAG: hypothetical protein ACFCUP_13650 [Actinomycetales bacterium]